MTGLPAGPLAGLLAGLLVELTGCAAGAWSSSDRIGGVSAASLSDGGGRLAPDTLTSVSATQRSWQFGGTAGKVITTPHYRVYTTITRQSILDRLPLFFERALAHYTTALAPLPNPGIRLDTFLFESRDQWEAKTRQMLPKQAATFLTLGRGGFTTRGTSVLYYIGRKDTLSIAAHEGWHQFSQETFRSQLPLWMEEGIATYMEGYTSHPDGLPRFLPWMNLERFHTLRDAVRAGRLIPLHDLLSRTPQSFLKVGKNELLIYYAQVWALTHFLAEGQHGRYRESLREVLIDAFRGRLAVRSLGRRGGPGGVRLGSAVLTAYFETDIQEFEQAYLQFIRVVVRTGGRDRVVQGRSPAADERMR